MRSSVHFRDLSTLIVSIPCSLRMQDDSLLPSSLNDDSSFVGEMLASFKSIETISATFSYVPETHESVNCCLNLYLVSATIADAQPNSSSRP